MKRAPGAPRAPPLDRSIDSVLVRAAEAEAHARELRRREAAASVPALQREVEALQAELQAGEEAAARSRRWRDKWAELAVELEGDGPWHVSVAREHAAREAAAAREREAAVQSVKDDLVEARARLHFASAVARGEA